MNDLITNITLPEVSIDDLLWNFLLSILLSFTLCWHFNARAKKRYIRRDLGLVLPVICLTTLLIISVVKSSLALSLGLVGALSIVRFRTPIKEPEELAYIFLAIAIGLALGADQREIAAISMVIILVVISVIDRFRPSYIKSSGNLLLNIEVEKEGTTPESILKIIESVSPEANIRRIDRDQNHFSIVALVKISEASEVSKFSKEFDRKFPKGSFSIIDDSFMPNE